MINLYEPVLTNALGLTLIHKDIWSLGITDSQRLELLAIFESRPEKKAYEILGEAAERLLQALKITHPAAKDYILLTADELYPRIKAAVTAKNIGGIFLSWEKS